RPRRVVGLVVAVALDPARAHEERVVVMGMLAGAGYVVAQVEARGGWRAGGGAALVLRPEAPALQTLLLALELGDEIRLLRLGVLQLALASLKTVAHLPVLPGGGVVTCVEVVEQDGPARPVHPRRLVAEQHRDRRPGALVRLDPPYLGVAAQHGALLLEDPDALRDLGDLGVDLLRLGQRVEVGAGGLVCLGLGLGNALIGALLRAGRARPDDGDGDARGHQQRAEAHTNSQRRCAAMPSTPGRTVIPRRRTNGQCHGPPPHSRAAMPWASLE